ncbi:MAG: NAD(P)-dependent alcohol dehydrogenase [Planctomycetes bacterium]|nr:NAD(P)-dependent alcohol dehydrogenase [Planctomycetota bacterium]
MKAITQDRYGRADVLALREIERPHIADDEVLVRVRAAGVDRGVWHLTTGMPYLMRFVGFGLTRPKMATPGMDLAGVVEAVGANVSRFTPGDEVFGIGKGAFAEYAVAKEAKLAPKPDNLSFEEAAVVAISGVTALQALRDVASVEPGQKVLIIGASGGVGSYAVQIARVLGAEVTGVCSTSKIGLVKSLGADHVIDYTNERITDSGESYDVILDIGGNRKLGELRLALKPKGTLVIVGGEEGGKFFGGVDRQLRAMLLSIFVGQKLTSFISAESQKDMLELKDMIEAGKIRPIIGRRYTLSQAPDALRDIEEGRARGKSVIAI